jgi:mono/diheme cytochrome c family protein
VKSIALALSVILASAAQADTPDPLFNNNCAICHQSRGEGVPGQFPRLAGRAASIASSAQGRDFLVALMLNGMSGTITVDKKKIVGVMPDFSIFSDEDLAAILTYVTGLGGPKPAPFTAAELEAARARPPIPPTDLANTRNELQASKVIP